MLAVLGGKNQRASQSHRRADLRPFGSVVRPGAPEPLVNSKDFSASRKAMIAEATSKTFDTSNERSDKTATRRRGPEGNLQAAVLSTCNVGFRARKDSHSISAGSQSAPWGRHWHCRGSWFQAEPGAFVRENSDEHFGQVEEGFSATGQEKPDKAEAVLLQWCAEERRGFNRFADRFQERPQARSDSSLTCIKRPVPAFFQE